MANKNTQRSYTDNIGNSCVFLFVIFLCVVFPMLSVSMGFVFFFFIYLFLVIPMLLVSLCCVFLFLIFLCLVFPMLSVSLEIQDTGR
jgi:hypothetical protein